jgi:hypothetical protein
VVSYPAGLGAAHARLALMGAMVRGGGRPLVCRGLRTRRPDHRGFMNGRCDRRRHCAIGAGTSPAITSDHNNEPQYERGQQQAVGQYAEPAHGTSDIADNLTSCPEVERAASIGSAYVGSNPRPPR